MGRNVVLLTNIPRPYRVPLFDEVHRRLRSVGASLEVAYYSNPARHARRGGEEVPGGNYPQASVSGLDLGTSYERVLSIPNRLPGYLMATRPSAIICGSFGPASLIAWAHARRTGTRFLLWSGATLAQKAEMRGLPTVWRRFLARRTDACITYGTAARDYLLALGVPSERIVVGVNTVNVAEFARQARDRKKAALEFKRQHRLEAPAVLCVGGIVERKGLMPLLNAAAQLQHAGAAFELHLVGDGPATGAVTQRARELGLRDRLHLWGAVPASEVPFYYALADVFVFPSLYDVWGLVLNEAMACGLPVVASSLAGATADLVEDGANGYCVDPRDTVKFTDRIGRLIADGELRQQMGASASAAVHEKASIARSADAFVQAVQRAILGGGG